MDVLIPFNMLNGVLYCDSLSAKYLLQVDSLASLVFVRDRRDATTFKQHGLKN